MSTTLAAPARADNPIARLRAEGRLLNPVLEAATHMARRFGLRGAQVLRFAAKMDTEAHPSELSCDQIMAMAEVGNARSPFFACYLPSLECAKGVAEVLDDTLGACARHFLFCHNIDLGKKHQVPMNGALLRVLPVDGSTLYDEPRDPLYLEKAELKKPGTTRKTDRVVDAATTFDLSFDTLTYAEGLALMGPLRNAHENRLV
jgi:hypothetical protein